MTRRALALLIAAVLVAACQPAARAPSGSSAAVPSVGSPAALTVYGAASLQGALEQVKAAYEASHPGTILTISTDSSAALRTQIEQGAPADAFLSADTTNPKKLVDAGLADGQAVEFAGNLLMIVVPTANPAKIAAPADLAKPGVKIIGAGDDVPITKYALQAVDLLAKQPGAPANFASGYAANVVSKEDNVKALIAKIELGEGDAGIVYVTDAKASTKVQDVAIPPEASVPATYAGVVVKASPNAAAAQAFLTWFAGPDGQAILSSFGFLPPRD